MGLPKPVEDQRYSYADYMEFPEGRWEIIDGEAFAMSPAPTTNHQRVVTSLFLILAQYFDDKPCEILPSPVDVRFPQSEGGPTEDERTFTVVQPDLVVVCDPDRIDERGIKGAPTLVIEVLSESTGGRDLTVKLDLYDREGVLEFWAVHPTHGWMHVFKRPALSSPFSPPLVVARPDSYTTALFPGLEVSMDRVFKRVGP